MAPQMLDADHSISQRNNRIGMTINKSGHPVGMTADVYPGMLATRTPIASNIFGLVKSEPSTRRRRAGSGGRQHMIDQTVAISPRRADCQGGRRVADRIARASGPSNR